MPKWPRWSKLLDDGLKHPKDTSDEERQAQGEMPAASADMEDADEAMSAPV